MKKIILVISVLCFICVPSTSFSADYSIPVTNEGDAYYWWSGRWNGWDVSANPNSAGYNWSSGSPANHSSTFLQFDLGGLPSGAVVQAAAFYFNVVDWGQYGTGGIAYVNHASNSSSATGNATNGIWGNETVAHYVDTMSLGWNSFDVTKAIVSDLSNNYRWSAFTVDEDGSVGTQYDPRASWITFSSAEGGFPAYLKVTTEGGPTVTPEPVSMALFGLGAGALGLARKRKKQ